MATTNLHQIAQYLRDRRMTAADARTVVETDMTIDQITRIAVIDLLECLESAERLEAARA